MNRGRQLFVNRVIYNGGGGDLELCEEDLGTAPARVAKYVNMYVAVGLQKFILTVFFVLHVGHTAIGVNCLDIYSKGFLTHCQQFVNGLLTV